MKRLLSICVIVCISVFVNAQTVLNESGVYELKKVEQYENKSAADLYSYSLEALSDVVGSANRSKTNIDVSDSNEKLIVYKGELYLGFRKSNTLCGYDTYAVFTLKVRCKDRKVQYTLTVPSLHMYWSCNELNNEIVPLNEIIPEFTHKGRLYLLKKGAVQFAGTLDEDMKKLYSAVIAKTIDASNNDF